MESKISTLLILKLSIFVFLFANFSVFSQSKKELENVTSSYKEYTKFPREISYTHFNKTNFLKGEILGFTAYIFDKENKNLSTTTTNVYCTISDEDNKVIKSEMILARNGVANGSFQIDSLFTPGQYIFKTYTNWMRNFTEPNYSIQSIKIIDPEVENTIKSRASTTKLDAQFLPEGGHYVADVKNSVGVIIKDSLGFGVRNIEGKVLDSDNNTLIDFKTNRFGIGKFTFTPSANSNYKVLINFNGNVQSFPIEKAENKGIALTVNDMGNKVAISFRTNKNTLKDINKQNYILAIHNGIVLKTINLNFEKSLEVIKKINYVDLSTGINIFTLFDENNKPILERLFFKYDGINLLTTQEPKITASQDSLLIKIPVNNIDTTLPNNFSISVLPEKTKSYNPNNNIISETFLKPYIKNFIENASYYFTDITRKKKFELSNVLLTLGWSSYDWNSIFNNSTKIVYEFENGISFRTNVNDKNVSKFMMYATRNNDVKLFDFDDQEKGFSATGLFPIDNEKLRFSAVKKNNIGKPNLYLMFSPSKIPNLNNRGTYAPLKEITTSSKNKPMYQSSWKKVESLDEVVLKSNKKVKRAEKLKRTAFGKVDVFDDLKRKTSLDFTSYIRTQGFKVSESMGEIKVLNPRGGSPTVYLDNTRLLDTNILYKFSMYNVDYVSINKSGGGEGGDLAGGVIKIYTDPTLSQNRLKRNVSQEVSVPLTFSEPKKFYVPEYTSYNSQFYEDYGVIDWLPKIHPDKDGNLQFTIPKFKTERVKIFIEGTGNDGSFISEEKIITSP